MESVRGLRARSVAAFYGLSNPIWGGKEKVATVIRHRAAFTSATEKGDQDGKWVRWKRTGEPFTGIYLPDRKNELFKPIPGRNIHSSSSSAKMSRWSSGRNIRSSSISPKMSRWSSGRNIYSSSFSAKMSRWSSGDDAEKRQIVSLKLTDSSTLVLQRGDITKWSVDGVSDAIVNAANERMLGGGGVDGAIHRAAGPELLKACRNVPEVQPGVRCPTGSARITEAFRLPVSHIIHTVGPIYDSEEDSESALSSAYRSCLKLARENRIKYVAFPAISCGVYRYPFNEAAKVALSTIQKNADDLEEVYFVLFDEDAWKAWLEAAYELLGEPETTVK